MTSIDDEIDLDDRTNYGSEVRQEVLDMADAAGALSEAVTEPQTEDRQGRTKNVKLGHNQDEWKRFRRIALDIFANAKVLRDESRRGVDPNERADLIVQIEELLESLMNLRFGKGECLARCVVAIQSVVLRAEWNQQHVDFMEDVSSFLKSRSYVDDSTVDTIYQSIEQHKFDPFRGVLST